MISKKEKIQKLALTLKESDILMCELESEREESLKNIRFDGEEELLIQYYKKNLTSVYRIRNNAAALLLRHNCTCSVSEDNTKLYLYIDDRVCEFSIPTIKNILQSDFDKILEKNRTDNPNIIYVDFSNHVDNSNVNKNNVVKQKNEKNIKQPEKKPIEKEFIKNTIPVKKEDKQHLQTEKSTQVKRDLKPQTEIHETANQDNGKNLKELNKFDKQPEKGPRELVEDDMDEFFWDEPRKKAEDKSVVKPSITKKMIEESNLQNKAKITPKPDAYSQAHISEIQIPKELGSTEDSDSRQTKKSNYEDNGMPETELDVRNVNDSKRDEESFWDLDDDFFGTADDSKDEKIILNPIPAIKEKREEKQEIEVSSIKDKHKQAKELINTDIPLENKENDLFFDAQEPFEWNDDDFNSTEAEEQTKVQEDKISMMKKQDKVEDKLPELAKNSASTPLRQPIKKEQTSEPKFNQEQVPSHKKERTDLFKFEKLTKETEPIMEEEQNTEPVFSSDTIDLDPEDILKKLKDAKSSREQAEIEHQILSETNKEISSGAVFDMSTGKKQTGEIDVEREANKIGEIADGVISTSKKDTLADKKLELDLTTSGSSRKYAIQSESDYKRKRSAFLYDRCKLTINIHNESDEFIKSEEAELIIFPLKIPESGNSLVTDICAYLESNGESHIAAVSPGGKTTVAIKSDEYAVFVRGSWENGDFHTAISVIGVGTKVQVEIKKDEIRPDNLMDAGIGHNVLYIDHITTVHIVPREEKNNLYEGDYVDFIAVIVRDYGIDQDCETVYTNHDVEMKLKGERYKYNLIGKWDDEEFRLKLMTK